MARIRSMHPGLFTDEAWVSCSPVARILILGLWTEADDQGIFEWKPLQIKMRLLPADNSEVPPLLQELCDAEIIRLFESGGKKYGAIKNFCKWQRPKTPQLVHPCPAEISEYTGMKAARDNDAAQPDRGTALGRLLSDQQEGLCFYCESEITFYRKRPNSLEIDHKIPVSRGGSDEISNLAACCKHCNSLKSTLTDEEFLGKFSPSELRERHSAKIAKDVSQVAKTLSADAKTPEAEKSPQMEDGGGREGDKKQENRNLPVSAKEPASSNSKRGTRLPAEYQLPELDLAYASSIGVPAEHTAKQFERFRDFWISKAGPGGVKLDWSATWRNWIRKFADERGFAPTAEPGTAPKPAFTAVVPGTEQWDAWYQHKRSTGTTRLMDAAEREGHPFPVPTEWPPAATATAA